ncbi:titin-like isoform X2 [Saccostrea echinata]|uniref:titin-like isoform X2 n=1 Tax=Saccostrea echinata TaxID=191078 RepID=UPI002A821AAB|nr:titin-like isoform X2 [Saccostrea echinata]
MFCFHVAINFAGLLLAVAQQKLINITGTAGGQVTLPCLVKNLGLYDEVIWQGPYQETISFGDRIISSDQSRYQLKQEYSDDKSLTISNLKSSDQAEYRCMKGATLVQIVYLWVKAPPRILDQNKTIEAFLGDKVMLRCQVTGTPPPTVKWYKEILDSGTRILEDLGTKGAHFSLNVKRDSEGTYTCQAENGISPKAQRYFRINVQLMPVITAPRHVEGERGQQAQLQCTVEGYPVGKVTWWHKGKQLTKDYRTSFKVFNSSSHIARYFLIISALESYDFGVYTCRASNNAGTATGQIQLIEKKTDIRESKCEKIYSPQCHGVLQTNFTLLPNSQGHTKQDKAAFEFNKLYTLIKVQCSKFLLPFLCGTFFPPCINDTVYPLCPDLCEKWRDGCSGTVSNFGFSWPFSCIELYHRLNGSQVCLGTNGVEKIAPFIKITKVSDKEQLLEGEKLTLHCTVIANTNYSITWYKIRKPSFISRPEKFKVGSGKHYVIENVDHDDAGMYICEAANGKGVMDSKNITVDVEFAPKVVVQAEVALMTGLDMDLKCEVLGNPPPIVTWSKQDNMFKTGRETHSKYSNTFTLKIRNMSKSDLGDYNCSAVNILGSDYGLTTIKDYGMPETTRNPEPVVIVSTTTLKQTTRSLEAPNKESSTSTFAGEKSGESQAVSNSCNITYLLFSLLLTLLSMSILHN